jgi:hypothetical protein
MTTLLRNPSRPLFLLFALAACEPNVPQQAPPSSVVTAVFDPLNGKIPLPNDLALHPQPGVGPALSPAQQELLAAFAAQGGFPNDQEVPVTIDFTRTKINADGTTTAEAPDLDFTTFTPLTLVAVLQTTPQAVGTVALDPIQATDYVKASDHGTLTLHNKGRLPWPSGEYAIAVRGGASGVKTTAGEPIYASPVFYLIAQGQPLDTEQNLALLRAQTGSTEKAKALAVQLDAIILSYQAAFKGVSQVFPQQELAVMATFPIAPIATQVQLDAGRGLVPLPIDLLRDPVSGKLTPLAACTLAGGKLDPAGVCRDSRGNVNAGAAGFATLDGFATTGAILASTSDLVQAKTVLPSTVQLYDLSNVSAPPVLISASSYITEPCEMTSSCSDIANALSPVIALQPAGATAGDPTSVFRTQPLKDATDYAVVISDGVKDKAGNALAAGTVAKILQFQNPLFDGTHSLLIGIDDATAGGLEVMRVKLKPVLAAAATNGIAAGHVAMAYTFHTQTILTTAAQLAAFPYSTPAATALPGPVTSSTPAAAFLKFGIDGSKMPAPNNIDEILETTITTFNLLDPATGAFKPNPAGAMPETINVLIATPKASNINLQTCAGPLAPFGKCSPMVVFRHGFGGGRANMLQVADGFAAQGMTVVAIDAAKHGDRSLCTGGQTTISVQGTTVPMCVDNAGAPEACVTQLPAGAQGDANPPGVCPTKFFKVAVMSSCAFPGCWSGADGIPVVSSNYLVTANFFRTRDTLRQDLIDQSQLVRAIAFAPSGPPPTGHSVFDHMAVRGVIIDPTKIYFAGQSLGSIQGTADVAANPRISKAVLNVGGGTVVDVFTNSPAFVATTNALLAGLGIVPGTAKYLQFLTVAKTVLDPAEPVNFAGHLQSKTLPNLFGAQFDDGTGHQKTKAVLAQAAFCDQVVPNPFSLILDANAGTGPLPIPGSTSFGGPGNFELFYKGTAPPTPAALGACPAPGGTSIPASAVSHGFLTDWSDTAMTTQAQLDAAKFLLAGTLPSSLTVLP